MALQKHRDLGSMPDGLMKTKVELTKGMAVTRRLNNGVYEIDLPATGDAIYGFVDARIDEKVYRFSAYDVIPAGTRAVVYTLVKDNEWRTDQFEGQLTVGDLCAVGTNGKLVKTTNNDAAVFEIVGVQAAMAGYENAMVVAKVL